MKIPRNPRHGPVIAPDTLLAALFVWVIWPGGSSWLVNSTRDFFEVAADKFGDAMVQGIRRNVDPMTFERLREPIAQMNALYEDVQPGDRYALTYVPGVGTVLALNDRTLGAGYRLARNGAQDTRAV